MTKEEFITNLQGDVNSLKNHFSDVWLEEVKQKKGVELAKEWADLSLIVALVIMPSMMTFEHVISHSKKEVPEKYNTEYRKCNGFLTSITKAISDTDLKALLDVDDGEEHLRQQLYKMVTILTVLSIRFSELMVALVKEDFLEPKNETLF